MAAANMGQGPSKKRALIEKANTTVVVVTSIAAFVVVFSLVASKSLLSQMSYQNRVIDAKQETLDRLEANLEARDTLAASYEAFIKQSPNIIGKSISGSASGEGDNAKIVLDALPSKYDFPALATSVEAIISGQQLKIDNIAGTDDQLAQQGVGASASPQPVAMPFEVKATGNYEAVQNLIKQFQLSIRPFQIQSLNITGQQGDLSINVKAQSFYQPEKALKITKETVK